MKHVLLAVATTFTLATSALAADTYAEVGVDFTQNANDKIVASTSIEVGLVTDYGLGSVGFVTNGNVVELDTYSIGTVVNGVAISYGKQGDLLDGFEGMTESVGGSTLANLDDSGESVKISGYGLSALIGLTDVTQDVTDVKNVQGVYAMGISGVEAGIGADYNLNTEALTLLTTTSYAVSDFAMGLTGTYDVDSKVYAHEADVTAYGVTAFLNGDNDDMLQNVGAGYYSSLNGMGYYYAEAAYNLDNKELQPAAGIAFTF